MMWRTVFSVAVWTVLSAATLAQTDPTSAPSDPHAVESSTPGHPPAASQPAPMASLIQKLPDFSGDLLNRQYLTGDWGGARTKLAENGIFFELDVTQWMQGNAHGGKDTNSAFRYSGSADFTFKFDTARMGLWPGGMFVLHGETQIGQSINAKSGAIMVPNYQALLPVPGDSGLTTLSEFYFAQALSEKFVVQIGKVDLSTGDGNEFAHDQRTQFSNLAFRLNPVLLNAGPYTTMSLAAVALPTDWLTITTAVSDNDPNGAATTTGFNTAFHGRSWLSVVQEYDFTLKPLGQTGHQRFGWFYTNRDFTDLEYDSRVQFPVTRRGRGVVSRRLLPPWLRAVQVGDNLYDVRKPETRPDDWGIYYNFDQYLYTESEDPQQGWGVFGRFGWSTGEANLFEQFYSLGLGGKGAIPTRDKDTWGVGYYLANLSDGVGELVDVSSEQGIELYYNFEVTPWLHITPDLQIIVDPGAGYRDRDPAIVYGIRAQLTF